MTLIPELEKKSCFIACSKDDVKSGLCDCINNTSVYDRIKTTWDLRECFKNIRLNKSHHLGSGDIILTIEEQEEICDLVDKFYNSL